MLSCSILPLVRTWNACRRLGRPIALISSLEKLSYNVPPGNKLTGEGTQRWYRSRKNHDRKKGSDESKTLTPWHARGPNNRKSKLIHARCALNMRSTQYILAIRVES
jgi:hypothetical protein